MEDKQDKHSSFLLIDYLMRGVNNGECVVASCSHCRAICLDYHAIDFRHRYLQLHRCLSCFQPHCGVCVSLCRCCSRMVCKDCCNVPIVDSAMKSHARRLF